MQQAATLLKGAHPTCDMPPVKSGKLHVMVFIPARNEADSIGAVIDGIFEHTRLTAGTRPVVVVGSDGSSDDTIEKAKEHGADIIVHEHPVGLGANFRSGVERALEEGADVFITIDGDGQFDPADVFKLLVPILKGEADFVTGSRFVDNAIVHDMPWIKRWGNAQMSGLISAIIGKKFQDVSCGYRAYNRKAILALNLFGDFTYTQEVFLNLAQSRLVIREVPITVQYFQVRTSRIASNLLRYGWQTVKIILSSVISYRPMWIFGNIALLSGAVGGGSLLFVGVYFLQTGMFSPYKYIAFIGIGFMTFALVALFAGLHFYSMSRIQQSVDLTLRVAKSIKQYHQHEQYNRK